MQFRLDCFVVMVVLALLLCENVCSLKTNGNVAKEAVFDNPGDEAHAKGDLQSIVDGRRTSPDSGECFAMSGDNIELHVQLTQTVNVSFVLLYAAAENQESLQTLLERLEVYVGEGEGEECVKNVPIGQNSNMALIPAVCVASVRGSRISLKLPGRGRILRLCEVEVYDITCDCLEGCEVDQAFCFAPCVRNDRCKRGNMAVLQPTDSSALIDISGPPSLVVNGNTGSMFVSRKITEDVMEQNCVVAQNEAPLTLQPQNATLTSSLLSRRKRATSSENDVMQWWSVDLGQVVVVQGVVIYRGNPDDVWENEVLTEVTVDGETCAEYGPDTLSRDEGVRPRLVVKCDHVIRGQKVKIARIRTSTMVVPTAMNLCEVQIWSCMAGWYGDQCQFRCGRCEGGRTSCDTVTGVCPDECTAGWYGPMCNDSCGQCSDGEACNSTTSHCDQGCAAGYLPPLCVDQEYTTITTTPSSMNVTRDDDSSASATIGAVFGALAATVLVAVVLFVWYRRRRGRLTTKRETARTTSHLVKTPAEQTESLCYTDAMSSAIPNTIARSSVKSDVTADVITGETTNDVMEENCYEALDFPQYSNMDREDEHVYVRPVFTRGISHFSNDSEGYVNIEASS